MLVEFRGKNSGAIVAIETDALVIHGPILAWGGATTLSFDLVAESKIGEGFVGYVELMMLPMGANVPEVPSLASTPS